MSVIGPVQSRYGEAVVGNPRIGELYAKTITGPLANACVLSTTPLAWTIDAKAKDQGIKILPAI